MAAFIGTMFFLTVFAVAIWSIVDSVRPRLGRILLLLQYGPAIGAELPPPPRVTVRERPVPVRASAQPLRLAA
jgi:hypothetical protein